MTVKVGYGERVSPASEAIERILISSTSAYTMHPIHTAS